MTVIATDQMSETLYNKLATLAPLVDADSIVYRSGFAADSQFKNEWLEANPGTKYSDPEVKAAVKAYQDSLDYTHIALANAKHTLQIIAGMFDEQRMRVFLTGKGNYREQVASIQQYKGNRDPTHKPKYYKELRQYLVDIWEAEIVDGMEADDALSIVQWEAKDKSTIIVSIDKDLRNTPGHHWNQNKHEYTYVTLAEANLNFWKQVGMGDGTDNIPGLKGVGIKTVEKWAEAAEYNASLLEERVRQEYNTRLGEQGPIALHENATLLWMQRVPGVNYDGSKLEEYQYEDYLYGNEEESEQSILRGTDSEVSDVDGRVSAQLA